MTRGTYAGLVAALLLPGLSQAQNPAPKPAPSAPATATAQIKDLKGTVVGTVLLVETPNGLLLRGTLSGLPPGTHAIHLHEVGKCEPPFKSAGGHFNPGGKAHGVLDPAGPHAGDLPNLVIPQSGKLDFEMFAVGLTLSEGPNRVLDADGTSVVIHAKADDYRTQPAGDAGDRIACGVVTK